MTLIEKTASTGLSTDMDTMKAIVQERYGAPEDVLHLGDVPAPIAGDDEVTVSVLAASAFIGDWHIVTGLLQIDFERKHRASAAMLRKAVSESHEREWTDPWASEKIVAHHHVCLFESLGLDFPTQAD